MPSGKEYSMRFILESQLGSNFKSSFTQAQKQLLQTQSQIQALSKEQANITAYQKQQVAVEKTSRKLMDLQKEYDNIQREISETEGFSSSLENKLIEKQRAIDSTSASLQKQTEKLNQYENALQESGLDTKNLGAESDRLTSELEELRAEQSRLNAETEEFGGVGSNAFAAVGDALIAAGINKGLNELKNDYIDCIKLSSEHQATMSTVKALSGANQEDMAQLSALAKELGATTKFTATESAQAMTYMAMAGWDASQMMSGMDGVMQLAAASGEDLALVSDIVTDNLTAFGLAASDTARFSDVLAAAATSSNTSVSIMGETFKSSAAIAGALGYSIEDVAVAVGLMANSGVKGSIAGTALKNMFNGLLEGATLTSKAFGEVEYTTINANGTLKSFSDTIDDLRVYFEQMTEAERVNNAMAIAGQRGYNGLLAILNATDADYQKLTESINNSAGAAQRMADIKLDNLKGQLTLLDSAADAVKTTVGEAYQNEFQGLAKIGTEILTEVNEFLTANPQVLRFFIALTAEVGALVAVYTTYKFIKSGMNVVQALHLALTAKETAATTANTAATVAETAATEAATTAHAGLNAVMAANPAGLVIAGVSALAVGIAALVSTIKKEQEEAEQVTYATQRQREELGDLNLEYERACMAYGETSWQAQELKLQVDELTASYEANAQTMSDFMSGIQEDIDSYNSMVESHKAAIEEINTEESSVMSLVGRLEELTKNSTTAKESQAEIASIIKLLNKELPDLDLNYNAVSGSLSMAADSLEEYAKAQYKAQKYQQNFTLLGEKSAQRETIEKNIKALESERKAALAASDEAQKELEAVEKRLDEFQLQSMSGRNVTSSIKTYSEWADKLKKTIKDSEAQVKQFDAELANLTDDSAENQAEIDRLNAELNDYIDIIDEANVVTEELSDEGLANLNKALQLVQTGELEVDAAAKMFGVDPDRLQESSDAMTSYRENLESAITAVENGWLSADEAADAYGVTVEEIDVASKIDETAGSLAVLVERYDEVYEAAYESINGQYGLWDTAAVVIPKNIEDINTALETQTSYWSDYNTDLTSLLGRVDDIEGLREIIASFADGSEDSVNAIAGMADASDEELREMVKNWQDVQKYQQEATDSVSELATGFSEQYGEMRDELETSVEALNLSDEAADAAEQTVDAYVEAIRSGTDEAVKEAERLSSLVAMALYDNRSAVTPSSFGAGGGGRLSYTALSADRMSNALLGYADGTSNAIPGTAIVGENGPELILLKGGERIFTAKETQKLLQESEKVKELGFGGSTDISINAYAVGTDNAAPGVALVGENGPEIVVFDGGEKVYTAEETQKLLQESERIKELDSKSIYENRIILNSYAAGTDGAKSGAALVGENGKELIQLGGGDIIPNTTITDILTQHINEAIAMQMLSAENAETVQVISMLSATPATSAASALPDYNSVTAPSQHVDITISPSFTVEGVKDDEEDIAERLRGFSEELKEEIIDALEEAGIDAKRREYV